ncbi:polyamine aminopropyltransferase [Microaerobacter geothermalis]|uniref:polyamine aminopropyltransferase n=1 Tax=Microaerobacter geothermalis TaxID=674972 RepID=UPI001F25974C|nr:polyamine aminopropyltransferase [Microaerobacter geothermalis]MCF6092974.1 polyamine aminopropyltransferase [Microaerobacter geothermalis]
MALEEMQFWFTERQTRGYRIQWRLKAILHQEKTKFQELAIVDTYDFGRALLLDGVIQVTEKDHFIYNEMISHIPMSTHPQPEYVLIIGGGDGGALKEILKYPSVKRVDMVEIDERVIANCQKYLPNISDQMTHPKANIIIDDGLSFIKNKKDAYDVIIVDSSDPVGPAIQLFERPFYESVLQALKEDGVMVCQSESPFFYEDILGDVTKTLKHLFPIVRTYLAVVPTYPSGLWSFTLASKKWDPLQKDISILPEPDTKYYTRNIYHSVFALPRMVDDIVSS